jgi:hypothetical protein
MLKLFKARYVQENILEQEENEETQRGERGNRSLRYDTKVITSREYCVQIHSIPTAKNVITNSDLNLEKDKLPLLQDKVFEFREGHNAHSLYLQWGRIDQLSSRKNRYIRQIILLSHIDNTAYIKILISELYDKITDIDIQITKILSELRAQAKLDPDGKV